MASLDEDAIDEILYLARTNEGAELATYLSELSAQTKRSKTELVALAADPYSKNSALHYAAANGHQDIIKLLCSTSTAKPATELINAINDSGNTPLHWAALNGHLASVQLMIELGADVTIINQAGHDAVFEAEINDKKEIVDWLLGAVEELEHGIGKTDEASGTENHDDHGMDEDDEAPLQHEAQPADDLATQMEGMKTEDGASRDG